MITNSVDEGILLSDRILALGTSLSAAVPVTLPRPRPADMMLHDENAVRLRARVTEFLTAGRAANGAGKMARTPLKVAVPVEA
jgi:ABC-type nitrate/sulfonate/bicarbonate transport system ATPase subunit